MTERYDWSPMPHKLDIKCPSCGEQAEFEFAEVKKIALKKDIPFFESSDFFDYHIYKDSCGHKWHAAVYFAGLHGGSTSAIRDLPQGYSPEDWNHSRYLYRNHGLDLGSFYCNHCNTRKRHLLCWPDDAYFSISYKSNVLWAFDRESCAELKDFISSNERQIGRYKWSNFLLHVPSEFKSKKARNNVVKQLSKALA